MESSLLSLPLFSSQFCLLGTRLLNGKPYGKQDKALLQSVSGYVHQSAVMHAHITVLESLRSHARLKLGKSVSAEERESTVQRLLDGFDLRHCQD